MGAAVEDVLAPRAVADAGRPQRVRRGHERGGAIDHRGIDGLSLSGLTRFVQSRDDAEREVEGAAAVVADQVERRRRWPAAAADGVQRSGERDVVEIVACRSRERSFLTPSGDPAVDESRIPGRAILRTEPEAFRHAGAEPLDERVGPLDETKHRLGPRGVLEIDRDARPAAVEKVVLRSHVDAESRVRHAIDAHHVGAELGKEHRAHRTRPDARELDDFQSMKRAHAVDLRRA